VELYPKLDREKLVLSGRNVLVLKYGEYEYELGELIDKVKSNDISDILIKVLLTKENKTKERMKAIIKMIYFHSYHLKKEKLLLAFHAVDGEKFSWVTNSLPMNLTIETTSTCNLHCVGCRETVDKLGFMKFEKFKNILLQFPKVDKLKFHSTGEPLLHPEIIRFIDFAKGHVKFLEISTNFSIKNDKLIEEIAKSKLDRLLIGLDGASQETYQIFRRGGNFKLVCANIKKIRARNPHCEIVVQMIPNAHNEHEVHKVKVLARSLGADALRIKILNSDNNELLPLSDLFRWELPSKDSVDIEALNLTAKEFICKDALNSMIILWDGTVYPCCFLQCSRKAVLNYDKDLYPKHMPYNIITDSAEQIWLDEEYFKLRYSFLEDNHRLLCKFCIKKNSGKPSGYDLALNRKQQDRRVAAI